MYPNSPATLCPNDWLPCPGDSNVTDLSAERSLRDEVPLETVDARRTAGFLHLGGCAQSYGELRVQRMPGLSQIASRGVERGQLGIVRSKIEVL